MAVAVTPQAAQAYSLHGCRQIPSGSSGGWYHISYTIHTGAYYGIVTDAARSWTNTPTVLYLDESTNGSIHVYSGNYGNTGWVGHADRLCRIPPIFDRPANLKYNDYYGSGYSYGRKQEVFAHEFGHALGLNHTSSTSCSNMALMEGSSTSTWDQCGFNTPRTDDSNGINAIY